jgi:hypothetical protein
MQVASCPVEREVHVARLPAGVRQEFTVDGSSTVNS